MNSISEFNRFFLSKTLASTYKPTFLKCLLDLGNYKDDEGQKWVKDIGDSLQVDLNFIAVRFIRFYWPLLFKFKIKQEATSTPIAVYRILNEYVRLFGENKSQPTKKQLCEDKFNELRSKIIREGIKPQVLRKLLNDCKIYELDKNSNSIIIQKDIVQFMKDNKKILEAALNHTIAEYLEKINQAPNISIKLEEKQLRTVLKNDDFSIIIKMQESRCFYCNETFTSSEFAQEHFIPWNYIFDTRSFNIVAACKECNSSKSDNLPHQDYLEKILQRNQKLKKVSHGYTNEGFKNLYYSCKSEYHGIDKPLWIRN